MIESGISTCRGRARGTVDEPCCTTIACDIALVIHAFCCARGLTTAVDGGQAATRYTIVGSYPRRRIENGPRHWLHADEALVARYIRPPLQVWCARGVSVPECRVQVRAVSKDLDQECLLVVAPLIRKPGACDVLTNVTLGQQPKQHQCHGSPGRTMTASCRYGAHPVGTSEVRSQGQQNLKAHTYHAKAQTRRHILYCSRHRQSMPFCLTKLDESYHTSRLVASPSSPRRVSSCTRRPVEHDVGGGGANPRPAAYGQRRGGRRAYRVCPLH